MCQQTHNKTISSSPVTFYLCLVAAFKKAIFNLFGREYGPFAKFSGRITLNRYTLVFDECVGWDAERRCVVCCMRTLCASRGKERVHEIG